jgi:hypothetical protein
MNLMVDNNDNYAVLTSNGFFTRIEFMFLHLKQEVLHLNITVKTRKLNTLQHLMFCLLILKTIYG